MDVIFLEDLAFFAYHGLYEEEARLGQRFHVDLACWLDLGPASREDDYALTVCYGTLTRTVETVVTGSRFKLIERLAGAIADAVLAADPRIDRVRVRVHKPGAPLPVASGRASVQIERARES
ncbi:dihydroneopterin aldolase [Microvirga tunisiensis]|uniref:7,8-dihydroneopterin aldolase n=1 Tax=Pannonibacter tanglangensis TaxID=2750084 RepID=A0A7X5J7I8_9HYPH|nr:dihydroneopterin aldolase [Pannonibacter sp. XCT-53]NBN77537.1 dihydroneopterin aldolase [Pannonibacter sp. XCT-53]